MDFTYFFKLISNNIDSINISLITGAVSSIFVSRIFIINSDLKEQFYSVQRHVQALNAISAYLSGFICGYQKVANAENDTIQLPEKIFNMIEQELNNFVTFYFEDLEDELHWLTADNNDLIYDMNSTLSKKNILIDDITKLIDRSKEILNKYYAYNYKKKRFKRIIKDRLVIFIFIIIITCLLLG